MSEKITPFLWFDGNAEDAANFYVSVFKDAKIKHVSRMGGDGDVMVAGFEILGQDFIALNGRPKSIAFTEATSFMIHCADQAEVDHYWSHLTADGGEESMCGWLKDKFGVSWQVTPNRLMELMSDPDPSKAGRVMNAMMGMRKIVIADLEKAAEGG